MKKYANYTRIMFLIILILSGASFSENIAFLHVNHWKYLIMTIAVLVYFTAEYKYRSYVKRVYPNDYQLLWKSFYGKMPLELIFNRKENDLRSNFSNVLHNDNTVVLFKSQYTTSLVMLVYAFLFYIFR